MNERRSPPPGAPKPSTSSSVAASSSSSSSTAAKKEAARRASSLEPTLLVPGPNFTEEGSSLDEGPVFEADGARDHDPSATHTMKAPQKTTISSTADVSVIEAKELRPAPSDADFDFPPRTTASELEDGIAFDEGYSPATEVLRLAFSDADGDSVTPSAPLDEKVAEKVAELPAVRKWRIGGGEKPPIPQEAQVAAPAASASGSGATAGPTSPPSFGKSPLPGMPPGAIPGAIPGANAGAIQSGTRVDLVAPSRAAAQIDVEELRRTLEEAEKLLRTVKHQAGSLDLDLVAPGARGMNAQLAAALHRLGEALAMLRK